MKRLFLALALCLIASSVMAGGTFLPWNLRVGSPWALDLANIEYTGKAYPVPADATSSYARLLDKGKKPLDNATLYSGQMLDFDGVDDYVDCGSPQAIATADTLTIAATFSTNSENQQVIVSQSYRVFELFIDVATTTTRITVYWGNGSSHSHVNIFPAVDLADGEIHRLIAVIQRAAGVATFYVDGIFVGTGTNNGYTCATTTQPFQVGQSPGGASPFDGFLGDVQVWNIAWSIDDVAYDYANPESILDNRSGTNVVSANLKGWWPLIAGSGDTAYDWSGNGNHGTLTGYSDVQTAWDNAAGLSDPRVCQTALMSWNLDAGVLRPIGTSGGTDFTREYNELNFHDGSYSSAPYSTDLTNTSAELVIEIVAEDNSTANSVWVNNSRDTAYGYTYIISHLVGTYPTMRIQQTTDNHTIATASPPDQIGGIYHYLLCFSRAALSSFSLTNGGYRRVAAIDDEPLITGGEPLYLGVIRPHKTFNNMNGSILSLKIYQGNQAKEIFNASDNVLTQMAINALRKFTTATAYVAGMATGDSFTTYDKAWPLRLSALIDGFIIPRSYSGKTLAYISTQIATDLDSGNVDFCVIQGGTNDITLGATWEEIKASMLACITACVARGIKPICVNISAKTSCAEDAGLQAVLDNYNDWLTTYCADNDIPLADINVALDTNDDNYLDAAYDSGDGLHPSTAGSIKIAETIKAAMGE